MSKELKENENSEPASDSGHETPEVVEIAWEEVQDLISIRRELQETQSVLQQMMLEYERRKRSMLVHMEALEGEVYNEASTLQEKYSVNPEWTYELKLPQQEGEKAYFVRKAD